MKNINYEKIQEEIEKKSSRRITKKKPKMKVSGKNVFKLKEIITKHNQKN